MKVTGSGGPAVLTVRFRERELAGLEAELAARRREPTTRSDRGRRWTGSITERRRICWLPWSDCRSRSTIPRGARATA